MRFPRSASPSSRATWHSTFDFKAHAPALAGAGLWRLDQYTLGEPGRPTRIAGAVATADMFDVLKVRPALGRFFTLAEDVPAADQVVVLTRSFWESHYDRDPGVIGRTMRLDGKSYEIIGVAPRRLEAFDARVKVIHPLSWTPQQVTARLGYSPQLFARLHASATLEQAAAQVAALEERSSETNPRTREFFDRTGHGMRVNTVLAQRADPIRNSLLLLQGAALFVLLIGCVNVANLLLARFNARRGEFTMRASLGASRGAILRQLLVETSLLTIGGAGLGLLLAAIALHAANHFTAQLLPAALPFGFDARVLGGTAFVAVAITFGIGIVPLAQVCGSGIRSLRPDIGRGASAGRAMRLTSGSLVAAQVAFALILLTGAGLLIRSFANVLAVEPGFDPRNVIAARIAVPKEKEHTFPPRLAAALEKIPDVKVSLASTTPFLLVPPYDVSMALGAFTLRNYALPAGASQPSIYYCGASPSYLDTLRIPLRAGRWFNDFDMEHGHAVVVDETFAERYFPGHSALGRRLVINAPPPAKDEDWLEIIGVAGNVRHNGVEDATGQPFAYLPLTQMPLYGELSVLFRTERAPSEVLPILRETVRAVDPELPIDQAGRLADIMSDSFSNRRGIMMLLAAFAAIALLLSAIGIYGVLAYDVAQRTREIGIRGALGATGGQIAGLIVRQGIGRTALGIAIGLAGASALSRFMGSLLFEATAIDPVVYGTVVAVLASVALVACWLPARRAARVDPVIALRSE